MFVLSEYKQTMIETQLTDLNMCIVRIQTIETKLTDLNVCIVRIQTIET